MDQIHSPTYMPWWELEEANVIFQLLALFAGVMFFGFIIVKLGEKVRGGGGALITAKALGQTRKPTGQVIDDYSEFDAKPPLDANSDAMIAEVAKRASEPPMPISDEKLFGMAFVKVPGPKPVPKKWVDEYGLKDKFHLE